MNRPWYLPFTWLVIVLTAVAAWVTAPANALTKALPLKQLAIEDVIYLPTVSSQREIAFTVPQSWRVSQSNLALVFQHSAQLIPHRSHLEVILNDKQLRRISLTRANAEQSTLTIPLSGLRRDNILKFRVEQHYTDKCEDPVDASLWTNVLNDTAINFTYQRQPLALSLADFPNPLIDGKAFDEPAIHYVVPTQQVDDATVTAAARLQAALGQAGRDLELTPQVHTAVDTALNTPGHVIMMATPGQLPAIADWGKAVRGATLQGNQWVGSNGQALSGKQAVVRLVAKPGEPGYGILLISANTSEGLLNAVNYLAHSGTATERDAEELLVPANWQANAPSVPKPRYINTQSQSFAELGFGDQYVEKLFAPPIQFDIPVVSDLQAGGATANLQVAYGYAPGLNPRYSSLEWRLNDRSIANIPLTNQAGAEKTHATIAIPTELLKPHNTLIAQFHMMPDKYGFCVDTFVDNAWGKIFTDDTRFEINGSPASRLPSVGLLNSTGFPYTHQMDMKDTHLVFADNAPSASAWQAWLALANRLGRMGDAPAGYQFNASLNGDDVLPNSGPILALGKLTASGTMETLPVQWSEGNTVRLLHPAQGNSTVLMGGGLAPEWQQGGKIPSTAVGLLAVNNDAGYDTLAAMLTSDDRFADIESAQIIHSANAPVGGNHGIALAFANMHNTFGAGPSAATPASGCVFSFLTWPIFAPLNWVLDIIRGVITWFVGLPVISHVIGFVFGLIWPVLTFGPLASVTAWVQMHTIISFVVGSILFWIIVSILFGLLRWLFGLFGGNKG